MLEEENDIAQITFIYNDLDQKVTINAQCGVSILVAAKENDIKIKGSCKGKVRCATCHLYIKDNKRFESIAKANEAEEETLKRPKNRKESSRLGCQLIIDKKNFDGIELIVPEGTYFDS